MGCAGEHFFIDAIGKAATCPKHCGQSELKRKLFRPAVFAAYSAASACISTSYRSCGLRTGYEGDSNAVVTSNSLLQDCERLADVFDDSPAPTCSASAATCKPSRMTTNSSPPSRATVSVVPHTPAQATGKFLEDSSPAAVTDLS